MSEKLPIPSNQKLKELHVILTYSDLCPYEMKESLDELKYEIDSQWSLAMKWRTRAFENKKESPDLKHEDVRERTEI